MKLKVRQVGNSKGVLIPKDGLVNSVDAEGLIEVEIKKLNRNYVKSWAKKQIANSSNSGTV